ncbi:MAG: RNA polymerase-binding protein DksA [Candidatus Magnetominusculus sp. LBB02]|nr:RNA polymerase-binding protein DksA [Candidatus Magnetominusculus sp. LBB02]
MSADKTDEKPLKAAKKGKKPDKRKEAILRVKNRLIYMRQQLLSGAEFVKNNMPDTISFPDLTDQASAEIDMNFMLKLKGREQKLLKKIDLSVERIEEGTYGLCENCGEEISIRRLEARPVTTLCIDCKTEQEEEEKMRED